MVRLTSCNATRLAALDGKCISIRTGWWTEEARGGPEHGHLVIADAMSPHRTVSSGKMRLRVPAEMPKKGLRLMAGGKSHCQRHRALDHQCKQSEVMNA